VLAQVGVAFGVIELKVHSELNLYLFGAPSGVFNGRQASGATRLSAPRGAVLLSAPRGAALQSARVQSWRHFWLIRSTIATAVSGTSKRLRKAQGGLSSRGRGGDLSVW
jgi:hypothetical protein